MNDATELSGATTLQTTLADLPTIIDPMIDALDRTEPLTFELFVPDRASNSAPGLLVYISPKPGAKMPPAWAEVLNNANLVWVGANDSGNEVHVQRRVALALAAPEAARAHCASLGINDINADRIYLAGFSGGGRVASMMAPVYPSRYQGAIYICGANPVSPMEEAQIVSLQSHRFVFLTGTRDFNNMDTQFAVDLSRRAGLGGCAFYVIDGHGHALPEPGPVARCIEFLEGDDLAFD